MATSSKSVKFEISLEKLVVKSEGDLNALPVALPRVARDCFNLRFEVFDAESARVWG